MLYCGFCRKYSEMLHPEFFPLCVLEEEIQPASKFKSAPQCLDLGQFSFRAEMLARSRQWQACWRQPMMLITLSCICLSFVLCCSSAQAELQSCLVARGHALPKHPPILHGGWSDTTGKSLGSPGCSYPVEHRRKGGCTRCLCPWAWISVLPLLRCWPLAHLAPQIQRPLPAHLHWGADTDQAQTQLPQVPFTLGNTVPPAATVTCCLIFAFCALLAFMSLHCIWHFGG